MSAEQLPGWLEWVNNLPEECRAMAIKYPLGTVFNLHGKVMSVIGYDSHSGVSVTPGDICQDYEQAVTQRQPVCACCADKLDELRIDLNAGSNN